ncbi:MAG: hypothetical protein HKM28_07360 [Flavobacteriaceae bacterium]|nr:hypothetical protein [Flavobacteriaceae bacterium]
MKILMRSFLLSLISLVMLSFSNCKNGKVVAQERIIQNNPSFSVEEATFQKWVAGTREGGSGYNIRILFKPLQNKVVPQRIFFKDLDGILTASNTNPNEYYANLALPKRDDVIMSDDPQLEAQNTPPMITTSELSDTAIIEYLDQDVVLYAEYTLKRLDPVFYPSSRPVDNE